MNHLETYSMAKAANVGAAKELLRFATNGRPKVINYISTLGVFGPHAHNAVRVVNEGTPIDHEKHRHSQGYVATKWVAEKIFMAANEKGIRCNIFRIGLVWADTQQGRFDELQRVYRVLKTCFLSGYGIGRYRYEMPPTPVDYVARAVVYLANRHPEGHGIFHISSSAQMIEGVFERCNQIAGTSLELMPLYLWIRAIQRLHEEGRSLPAVPLIEFAFSMDEGAFQEHQRVAGLGGVQFDCARTHRELEKAGIVAPVLNDELLKLCVAAMFSRDMDLREVAESENSDWLLCRQATQRCDVLSGMDI
jgi:thioester reductase-like protein